MRGIGYFLIAFGALGAFLGANQAAPGTDPYEALGQSRGPFLFIGVGALLVWKGRKKTN